MSKSKVVSEGNVPFSWENKPGISKVKNQECRIMEGRLSLKLPPPPCPKESARFSVHGIQIPLPPCAFHQPHSRSSSKKGLLKHDHPDPFLAAFKECTKSSSSTTNYTAKLPKNFIANKKLGMFNFSCRHSCSVRGDNLVRIPQLPLKRDEDR